jgi:hypothetical protein
MMFIFNPMSFPANAQVEDVAERLLTAIEPTVKVPPDGTEVTWADLRREELLRVDALRHTNGALSRIEYERSAIMQLMPKYVEPMLARNRVLGGVNSHEREDIRDIYNKVYAMKCTAVNPGKFGGIEQLNRDMQVDISMPHPFRPGLMGFSRFFVVVPDDTTVEESRIRYVTRADGSILTIYPPPPFSDSTAPELLHDHELFRYQMVNWRVIPAAVTVTGEIIDRPEKANDDFPNALQMCAVLGPLQNTAMTPEEEFEELIPDHIRRLANGPMTKQNQHAIEMARFHARVEMLAKYDEEDLDMDEPSWLL